MKKNRKKIIIIILLCCLFSLSIFSYFRLHRKVVVEEFNTNIKPVIENKIDDVKVKSQKEIGVKYTSSNLINTVNLNEIKVSLDVSGKTYNLEVKEGSSVFDVMNKLEENNLKSGFFSFKYTEHLGLGAFINEINGIKGFPGQYWIYYVNNIKASIGVSNYVLKAGDIISWKQESF